MSPFVRRLTCCITASLPLYYWKVTILNIPTNVIELLILTSFSLSLLSQNVKNSKGKEIPRWMQISIVLFVVGALIGLSQSSDLRSSLGMLKSWIIIPIMYAWVVYRSIDSTFTANIARCLVFSALTVSLYAILQWLGYIPLIAHQLVGGDLGQYVSQGRSLAFFESPNYLAMYLAPLVPVTALSVWMKIKNHSYTALIIILPILAILLSGSRAGLLSVVCGALVVLFQRNLRVAYIFIALISILAFGWLSLSSKSNGGDAARLFIWQGSVEIIKEKPIVGIGLGSFQHMMDTQYASNTYYNKSVQAYSLHPHNVFLSAWLSVGLLGLLGLTLIIVYSYRKTIMHKNLSYYQLGAIGGITAIIIHGLFDTTIFKNDLAIIFWLLVVLLHFSPQMSQNTTDE